MPGGYLWPLFLAESHGNDPALIRAIWEEAAGPQPGTLLEILDRILIGSFGDSFRESFLKFAIWNTYTGKNPDRNNVYGFFRQRPGTYELTLASASGDA